MVFVEEITGSYTAMIVLININVMKQVLLDLSVYNLYKWGGHLFSFIQLSLDWANDSIVESDPSIANEKAKFEASGS